MQEEIFGDGEKLSLNTPTWPMLANDYFDYKGCNKTVPRDKYAVELKSRRKKTAKKTRKKKKMEKYQIWSSRIVLGAVAFALLFLAASADDVVVLSEENFEKEVGQDRGALVEFYAPWCGHCKKLAPEYEKLGSSFKKAKSVLIGKVDCDEHKSLCSKYGVSGYPTLQWFPKGSLEPKKYEGPRTAESLAEFVNTEGGTNVKIATAPSNVVVLTPENFNEIVLDETKDVLTYEKVATAFKLEENVVIANLDADKYRDLAEKSELRGPSARL
ncbi:hypothetical protein V8G54_029415 [Vigna mungo]|uniref:protein disulfide-isomerase n=1 Tax=Vigna mungo TaxID=3915 RepID=A0AAQ3MUU1_VIGMU